MFDLSARKIVVLAALCFAGSLIVQVWWIRSAYEGELSLYNKEKRQFQVDLEERMRQDKTLIGKMRTLLQKEKISSSSADRSALFRLTDSVVQATKNSKQYGIELENFGIAVHEHDSNQHSNFTPVVFADSTDISDNRLAKASRICLHCILQDGDQRDDNFTYQLLLIYAKERTAIFKRIAVLIAFSLLLLLFLIFLFRLLLKKYRQEKTLSEVRTDFINNLSHEMQTPVFVIQLAAKLIREKGMATNDTIQYVDIIDKETQQLKEHAAKVLELASLESEHVPLDLQTTEVNSWLASRRPTFEIMLQSAGGKLVTRFATGKLFTQLDQTHFNNVLTTLLENAKKYNRNVPEATIETGVRGKMIFITIEDNGIGIEQQYLPHVFEKFYRVPHTNNNIKGFGIGLSYVKQVVALHKGMVEIKSTPGTGTVITILLPMQNENV